MCISFSKVHFDLNFILSLLWSKMMQFPSGPLKDSFFQVKNRFSRPSTPQKKQEEHKERKEEAKKYMRATLSPEDSVSTTTSHLHCSNKSEKNAPKTIESEKTPHDTLLSTKRDAFQNLRQELVKTLPDGKKELFTEKTNEIEEAMKAASNLSSLRQCRKHLLICYIQFANENFYLFDEIKDCMRGALKKAQAGDFTDERLNLFFSKAFNKDFHDSFKEVVNVLGKSISEPKLKKSFEEEAQLFSERLPRLPSLRESKTAQKELVKFYIQQALRLPQYEKLEPPKIAEEIKKFLKTIPHLDFTPVELDQIVTDHIFVLDIENHIIYFLDTPPPSPIIFPELQEKGKKLRGLTYELSAHLPGEGATFYLKEAKILTQKSLPFQNLESIEKHKNDLILLYIHAQCMALPVPTEKKEEIKNTLNAALSSIGERPLTDKTLNRLLRIEQRKKQTKAISAILKKHLGTPSKLQASFTTAVQDYLKEIETHDPLPSLEIIQNKLIKIFIYQQNRKYLQSPLSSPYIAYLIKASLIEAFKDVPEPLKPSEEELDKKFNQFMKQDFSDYDSSLSLREIQNKFIETFIDHENKKYLPPLSSPYIAQAIRDSLTKAFKDMPELLKPLDTQLDQFMKKAFPDYEPFPQKILSASSATDKRARAPSLPIQVQSLKEQLTSLKTSLTAPKNPRNPLSQSLPRTPRWQPHLPEISPVHLGKLFRTGTGTDTPPSPFQASRRQNPIQDQHNKDAEQQAYIDVAIFKFSKRFQNDPDAFTLFTERVTSSEISERLNTADSPDQIEKILSKISSEIASSPSSGKSLSND